MKFLFLIMLWRLFTPKFSWSLDLKCKFVSRERRILLTLCFPSFFHPFYFFVKTTDSRSRAEAPLWRVDIKKSFEDENFSNILNLASYGWINLTVMLRSDKKTAEVIYLPNLSLESHLQCFNPLNERGWQDIKLGS